MTYLVLARKWRPRSFETLVGQDHVVRALTHALSTQRLHHAWLFTGTRGVGKTTLSRILAKSLNCENGITATPCGVCRACTEIDAGRFVDYVELDAASNRGVDEMTQLLEQAVYAPSSARFKVYMIDEVHMLTGHAFNAMLKTLEEPPAHVKFILATTDPQKIPVTVLSRCLQFNLKQMTADSVVGHLQQVLHEEGIPFEAPALRLLGQAASGSMRDALSLTDQAIAYSAGNLSLDAVQGMLGTIDQRHLVRLLSALADRSAAQVLEVADELATRGLSYSGALGDMAVMLSRIAIAQRVPDAVDDGDPLAADIIALSTRLHPDLVQLFYSVAVHSRSELSLAPDEHAGFIMACLRMLALASTSNVPAEAGGGPKSGAASANASSPEPREPRTEPAPSSASPAIPRAEPSAIISAVSETVRPVPEPELEPASGLNEPRYARGDVKPAPQPGPVSKVAPSTGHLTPVVATPPEGLHDDDPSGGDEAGSAPSTDAMRKDTRPAPSDEDVPAWEDIPVSYDDFESMAPPGTDDEEYNTPVEVSSEVAVAMFDPAPKRPKSPKLKNMDGKSWPALAAALSLTGLASELARQSEWVGVRDNVITLRVAVRTLAQSPGRARLCTLLSEHFGVAVQLNVEFGATGDETAHAVQLAEQAQRQQLAEQAVQDDPFVQDLIAQFGARLVPGSVKPITAIRAS